MIGLARLIDEGVGNILTTLPNIIQDGKRISEEYWLGNILVDQVRILLVHHFIHLVFVYFLNAKGFLARDPFFGSVDGWLLDHSPDWNTAELSVPIEIVGILVLVKELFEFLVELVTLSRVLRFPSLPLSLCLFLFLLGPLPLQILADLGLLLLTDPIDNKSLHPVLIL